jgi:hypothetical protein
VGPGAVETFQAKRDKLFRSDGKTRIYSDDEHAERLGVLRRERNAVLMEVEEQARAAIEEDNANLTVLENGDPTTLLTTEELGLVNARRPLVADDIASLSDEELQGRLEAVLHGGARDSMFVYLQAGRRRVRSLPADRVPPDLSRVLDELTERLIPDSRKAEIEATRKRIEEAGDVRGIVYLGIREQSSVYAPQYSVPG